jgi:hypothetical protein
MPDKHDLAPNCHPAITDAQAGLERLEARPSRMTVRRPGELSSEDASTENKSRLLPTNRASQFA